MSAPPRAVTVTSQEDRSAMVTVEGLCNLPLSEPEARALWVGLGNHLCEPADPTDADLKGMARILKEMAS